MVGTLPTGSWKTNVVLGSDPTDFGATIGTQLPTDQLFAVSQCDHTDTQCLIAAAKNAGMLSNFGKSFCSNPGSDSMNRDSLGPAATFVPSFANLRAGGDGGPVI